MDNVPMTFKTGSGTFKTGSGVFRPPISEHRLNGGGIFDMPPEPPKSNGIEKKRKPRKDRPPIDNRNVRDIRAAGLLSGGDAHRRNAQGQPVIVYANHEEGSVRFAASKTKSKKHYVHDRRFMAGDQTGARV